MKGAGKYHGLSENADWSLFVPEPPAPHALPGTGRHINKCLLNWISPIAVQQNRLSHGEQQANGLITCCFRTKWIKSWTSIWSILKGQCNISSILMQLAQCRACVGCWINACRGGISLQETELYYHPTRLKLGRTGESWGACDLK